MKITDILKEKTITVSCELFPPKHGSGLPEVKKIVKETASLNPSFISVTYGAGGSTGGNTVAIADEAQNINGVPVLAHLTCVSSTRERIRSVISELKIRNIQNILALRGDIQEGTEADAMCFRHANELITEIYSLGNFCVGGACYPEGHPESPTIQKDIEFLKIKVESGCRFLTTQMFFDNNVLYNYMFRLLKHGIDVPVIAGIMPVTNARQIERICKLSGTALPPRFKAIVDRFSDNPASMNQAGIAYATEQIIDLIANGVGNIHIYTMNKPDIAGKIMENLSEIIK